MSVTELIFVATIAIVSAGVAAILVARFVKPWLESPEKDWLGRLKNVFQERAQRLADEQVVFGSPQRTRHVMVLMLLEIV